MINEGQGLVEQYCSMNPATVEKINEEQRLLTEQYFSIIAATLTRDHRKVRIDETILLNHVDE